jgi:hypothetical protein
MDVATRRSAQLLQTRLLNVHKGPVAAGIADEYVQLHARLLAV